MRKSTSFTVYDASRQVDEDNEVGIYPLNSMSFASAEVGWAVGSRQVLYTRDGGVTWVNQYEQGPRGLRFGPWTARAVDPETCWIIGLLSAGDFYCAHTRDAGLNWRGQKFRPKFFPNDVCFSDPKRGWIVGDDGEYHSGARAIFVTEDGGDSWEEVGLGVEGRPGRVEFLKDGRRGWLVENSLGAGGHKISSRLHASVDGGHSWEPVFDFRREVSDFFAHDSETFVVAGEDGFFARTADGGRTWQRSPTRYRGYINAVTFHDRRLGLLMGDYGALLLTEDGGETWQRLDVLKKAGNLVGAFFLSESRAVVASSKSIHGLTL